jgi:hypothetical protein
MAGPAAFCHADAVDRATLLGTGRLRGTGQLTGTGLAFRRRSCCLYYRLPGGGLCGDCCLRRVPGGDMAHRLNRPAGSG